MSAQPVSYGDDPRLLRGEIERLEGIVAQLGTDLHNVERALRVERRKCDDLRRQLEDKAKSGPQAADLEAIHRYWTVRCRHPRAKLDTKRAAAVKARLNAGHTVDEVKWAIDGAALDAFVAENGKRFDELELICRDEVRFDSFLERRRLALERHRAVPLGRLLREHCLPAQWAGTDGLWLDDHAAWAFRCPVCRAGWDDELPSMPLRANREGVECIACGVTEPLVVKDAILLPPVGAV